MVEELRAVRLISDAASTKRLCGKEMSIFPTGMPCKLFPRYLGFTGGTLWDDVIEKLSLCVSENDWLFIVSSELNIHCATGVINQCYMNT